MFGLGTTVCVCYNDIRHCARKQALKSFEYADDLEENDDDDRKLFM